MSKRRMNHPKTTAFYTADKSEAKTNASSACSRFINGPITGQLF